jgi:hypothetical protein
MTSSTTSTTSTIPELHQARYLHHIDYHFYKVSNFKIWELIPRKSTKTA